MHKRGSQAFGLRGITVIRNDFAVAQENDAVALLGGFFIVRDDERGLFAFAVRPTFMHSFLSSFISVIHLLTDFTPVAAQGSDCLTFGHCKNLQGTAYL